MAAVQDDFYAKGYGDWIRTSNDKRPYRFL